MIDYELPVQAESEPQDPGWVVMTAAFFREESLSRRGAAYRLTFLAVVVILIVLALIAESHG